MYIGISAYNHESAIAIVNKNGELLDYCKEESLSRIKGDQSFPKRALKRLIQIHNIDSSIIEKVIFYEKPLSSFLIPLKIASKSLPGSLDFLVHQLRNFKNSSINCFLDLNKFMPGLENKLIYIDHHLSHTLTALLYSKSQENICSIVVDGFGDRSTSTISFINNINNIRELWAAEYPYSLGLFYSTITDFLGFAINEGEYKVMGLSAYGNENSPHARLVKNLIKWNDITKNIDTEMEYFSYHKSVSNSYSEKLTNLLGEPRNPFVPLMPDDKYFQKYADIAKGAQDSVNMILKKIFEHAYNLTNSNKYLFSGGVALNSACLNSLAELSFVDELIVPPSPGDSGAAIGSAFYGYITSNKKPRKILKPSLFPSVFNCNEQLEQVKKIISEKFELISDCHHSALQITSKLIKNGEIIGTIISNSETGPRALGNRSLLCDGLNKQAVDTLNTVIKNRSPFRPTAPAMTIATAKKYYQIKSELKTCYLSMNATCKCIDNNISLDFPVTHIDGTARIQIVEDESILDQLLCILKPMGIEILANSSLNISGDPTCFDLIDSLMVCSLTPLKYLLTDFGLLKKK